MHTKFEVIPIITLLTIGGYVNPPPWTARSTAVRALLWWASYFIRRPRRGGDIHCPLVYAANCRRVKPCGKLGKFEISWFVLEIWTRKGNWSMFGSLIHVWVAYPIWSSMQSVCDCILAPDVQLKPYSLCIRPCMYIRIQRTCIHKMYSLTVQSMYTAMYVHPYTTHMHSLDVQFNLTVYVCDHVRTTVYNSYTRATCFVQLYSVWIQWRMNYCILPA